MHILFKRDTKLSSVHQKSTNALGKYQFEWRFLFQSGQIKGRHKKPTRYIEVIQTHRYSAS